MQTYPFSNDYIEMLRGGQFLGYIEDGGFERAAVHLDRRNPFNRSIERGAAGLAVI
jgi:hypothetical protein